jgi:hypothetical protein
VDGIGAHHVEQDKPNSESQLPITWFAHMRNLDLDFPRAQALGEKRKKEGRKEKKERRGERKGGRRV